ncbi:putative non-specific serine/threonine protein kinase [Helianthus anomalus]
MFICKKCIWVLLNSTQCISTRLLCDLTRLSNKQAWKHFKQGKVEEIFDPNLMMHIRPNIKFQKEAIKVVHIGLLCTQESPSLRPSMSAALKMLATNDEPLPAPTNPPFIDEGTMELNNNMTQRLLNTSNTDDSSSVSHTLTDLELSFR